MSATTTPQREPMAVVARLLDATNTHDLAALTSCFATDYVNTSPAHPSRGFTGREQVNANWSQLFASIPDLQARITNSAVSGSVVWSEWTMTGTRADGSAHEMAGVILFTVRDGEIAHANFYLEPVERQSGTVADNIRRQASGATS
ncbi:MAG: nuclear transport factor 2 family protein [Pseudolysinimonas sp.]